MLGASCCLTFTCSGILPPVQSGQALGSPTNHCEDHDGDDDDAATDADDDDNNDVGFSSTSSFTCLLLDLFPANVGQHLYLGGKR